MVVVFPTLAEAPTDDEHAVLTHDDIRDRETVERTVGGHFVEGEPVGREVQRRLGLTLDKPDVAFVMVGRRRCRRWCRRNSGRHALVTPIAVGDVTVIVVSFCAVVALGER